MRIIDEMLLLFKHLPTSKPHLISFIHEIIFFYFLTKRTYHPLVLKDSVIQAFCSESLLIFIIDHSDIDTEDKGRKEITLIAMSVDVRMFDELVDILIKLSSHLSESV